MNPMIPVNNDALSAILNLVERDCYQEAEKACKKALKLDPKQRQIRFVLAGLLAMQSNHGAALKAYKQIKRASRTWPDIDRHIAICFLELKQFAAAKRYLAKAMALNPTDQNALRLCVQLYLQWEKWRLLDQASEALLKQIPKDSDASYGKGVALFQARQFLESEPYFMQVLKAKPDCTDAYKQLALAFERQGKVTAARHALKLALKQDKTMTDVLQKLASLANKQGDTQDALATLKALHKLEPTPAHRVLLDLFLPANVLTIAAVKKWRTRFTKNIDQLSRDRCRPKDPFSEVGITNFYMPYQGLNDRIDQEKTAALYKGCYPRKTKKSPGQKTRDSRIRIGFLSAFFHYQSVSLFYANMIAHLPEDFYVVVFHATPRKQDAMTAKIRRRANAYIQCPEDLQVCREQVTSENLDMLVYPEIGMHPIAYYLSMTRLAPVQCALMGHPVTTGIPTIDYYISSDLFESQSADDHYSEKLIRVGGMPVNYSRPAIPRNPKTRRQLDLPKDSHIYLCPMTLFKIHPDFDTVVAGILQKDANAAVLFFNYYGVEAIIKKRLAKRCRKDFDRIHFRNTASHSDFLSLLARSDVILETFPFGGGNTALMALAAGSPVVTMPTQFLRGRFCYGYYKRMDMTDCIANSPQDYVRIATRIGMDPDYRQTLRKKILSRNGVLFGNTEGVEEHYQFFRSLKK